MMLLGKRCCVRFGVWMLKNEAEKEVEAGDINDRQVADAREKKVGVGRAAAGKRTSSPSVVGESGAERRSWETVWAVLGAVPTYGSGQCKERKRVAGGGCYYRRLCGVASASFSGLGTATASG